MMFSIFLIKIYHSPVILGVGETEGGKAIQEEKGYPSHLDGVLGKCPCAHTYSLTSHSAHKAPYASHYPST